MQVCRNASVYGGGGVLGWLVLMLAIYLTIWIYIWFMVDHELGAPELQVFECLQVFAGVCRCLSVSLDPARVGGDKKMVDMNIVFKKMVELLGQLFLILAKYLTFWQKKEIWKYLWHFGCSDGGPLICMFVRLPL